MASQRPGCRTAGLPNGKLCPKLTVRHFTVKQSRKSGAENGQAVL
jgi:hypothetical protein